MATNNAVNTTLSSQTGTGSFVGSTSPALVTPDLGTPSAGVLTSCTGLPVSSGISGLGTGVATALAANVNGSSGGISLSTSPTFVTPVLGAATATSINFGGSTLSDYVTRTAWTPSITFVSPGDLSVAYGTRVGFYSRVGSEVNVIVTLVFTPTYTTATGNFSITGLPITSVSTSSSNATGVCQIQSPTFPAGTTSPFLQVTPNTSVIAVKCSGSGVSAANFSVTQFLTGVAYTIIGYIMYYAT